MFFEPSNESRQTDTQVSKTDLRVPPMLVEF